MSIDAKIELVTYEQDGTVRLHLGPRTKRDGPGQPVLTVLNPKPRMEVLEGMDIWGNANVIMLGDTHWADRESYTTIRLRTPPQPEADDDERQQQS